MVKKPHMASFRRDNCALYILILLLFFVSITTGIQLGKREVIDYEYTRLNIVC